MLKKSFGLKAVVQKNDAFIKIHAEIEKKMTCIKSAPKFVLIWTIFLSVTFSSDIYGIEGNLFHNMSSHICFADILLGQDSPICNFLSVINLINQFTIIFEIRLPKALVHVHF